MTEKVKYITVIKASNRTGQHALYTSNVFQKKIHNHLSYNY